MAEFTPIETQERLDMIISQRVKEEKELRAEVENLKSQLAAKDKEMSTLSKTHELEEDLRKRGLTGPAHEGKVSAIKRLVDLDGEEDVSNQLDSLASSVPDLF